MTRSALTTTADTPLAAAPTHLNGRVGAADDKRRAAILAKYPSLDLHALVSTPRPPREWTITGLLPAGTACALVAKGGAGKSLLALAASISIAAGYLRFAGLEIPRARRVLYVDMENTEDDLWERVVDLGVTTATDLSLLTFLHLPNLPPLDRPEGARELLDIVWAYALEPGDVVVLDSTQRIVVGIEDAAETWRDYYRHTGVELKRQRLTVLLTDNTGKDETRGARGSSSKRDAVDVMWLMTASGEDGESLRLVPDKHRIRDVHTISIERVTHPGGTIGYSTANDSRLSAVRAIRADLDKLGVPASAGVKGCGEALRDAGYRVANDLLRDAVKLRKSVPEPSGTPPLVDRAE